jgi:hypothetical protein
LRQGLTQDAKRVSQSDSPGEKKSRSLNSIRLRPSETDLGNSLLDLYFNLFYQPSSSSGGQPQHSVFELRVDCLGVTFGGSVNDLTTVAPLNLMVICRFSSFSTRLSPLMKRVSLS